MEIYIENPMYSIHKCMAYSGLIKALHALKILFLVCDTKKKPQNKSLWSLSEGQDKEVLFGQFTGSTQGSCSFTMR